jgi:hypothetical protein
MVEITVDGTSFDVDLEAQHFLMKIAYNKLKAKRPDHDLVNDMVSSIEPFIYRPAYASRYPIDPYVLGWIQYTEDMALAYEYKPLPERNPSKPTLSR